MTDELSGTGLVLLADKPSGNLSRVLFTRSKQPNVWTTKRQRHTKRLSFSHDDVRRLIKEKRGVAVFVPTRAEVEKLARARDERP
mgnify:CR=1 FL=1